MGHPIVYVDVSRIREGSLEKLEAALGHLSGFVEGHMPRVLSYGLYLDGNRETMTVVAVHPDSDSLEFHLDEGNEEFRTFADLVELSRIEVYGEVSDGARERLDRKARMLGHATVTVHRLHAGFSR